MMELTQAIESRRSIRRFRPDALPKESIEAILRAASLAPSAKNRQPWRFVVVTGQSKAGLLAAIERGIQTEQASGALLPGSRQYIPGALHTLSIVRAAPVTVLVFDAQSDALPQNTSPEEWFYHCANIQSIGAAIQDMCLAATNMGIGSLWICDVFFAHREILAWAKEPGSLVAAVSFGYPAEAPSARPRLPLEQLVVYKE